MLRRRLAVLASALAITGAVAATPAGSATAPPHGNYPAVAAKACSAGYTHAVIGGEHKCLRRGQYCSIRYKRQYPRYGFRCVAGRLR
jgi:hypothetical protein